MEDTDRFKETILDYLEEVAAGDPVFAEKYKSKEKNIDDCTQYILNTVQKSGANGFASSEIFGMAMHYYDEEKVDIGKEITAKVVVNHHVELTEEEKASARQAAIDKAMQEERTRITTKRTTKKKVVVAEQTSLF